MGSTSDEASGRRGGPFGALLRRLRREAGLTQEELASQAGLTPNVVSALERGARRRPYPHTVRSLADALRFSDEGRRRHAAYFLAEAAEAELVGMRQAEWLGRLETEHDNLRATLSWFLEKGDAGSALRPGSIWGAALATLVAKAARRR